MTSAAILVEQRKPLIIDEIELPPSAGRRPGAGQGATPAASAARSSARSTASKARTSSCRICSATKASRHRARDRRRRAHVKPGDTVVMHWRKGLGIEAAPPAYTWSGKRVNAGWVTTFNEYAVDFGEPADDHSCRQRSRGRGAVRLRRDDRLRRGDQQRAPDRSAIRRRVRRRRHRAQHRAGRRDAVGLSDRRRRSARSPSSRWRGRWAPRTWSTPRARTPRRRSPRSLGGTALDVLHRQHRQSRRSSRSATS